MTRNLLITAGPTYEPIDAVRYLANRSSGRLGIALAAAGQAAGWDVVLLLGPSSLAAPGGVRTLRFETTAELAALLEREFPRCDVLFMAAAVADYRLQRPSGGKLARTGEALVLELEPTPDLVAACAGRKRNGQRIIGFALEAPDEMAARAAAKLRAKRLDAIVANPLETMGAPNIAATLVTADGAKLTPPAGSGLDKRAFADWLIAWLGPPG